MALVSLGSVALMKLVVVAVAGFCGLRMCRAMHLSVTRSNLRREAAIAMLKPGNSYGLSSCQQAAVLRDLCASGQRLEGLKTSGGRSSGFPKPRFIE